ncbi:hypothetical protein [Pseudomonas pseudonitroreducens]|uniref:hypothetical protein n=1 Tax=Pseudomonas pseudonitroreducens TaxID=2892326 RepID=UPI001F1639BC|nr:hypothetical protein [Pseudomonas pseudonitroreducens]
MIDVALLGMTALVALLAFVAGHATAGRSSSVRLVDKWPHAHVQFDSGMSQEDVLRFLDMTREMVLTGELAKPNKTKDERASHQGKQPLGARDD